MPPKKLCKIIVDTMWNKVYDYAKRIAELHSIDVAAPTSARKKRPPKHFEDSVSLNLQDHVRFCHLVKSTKGIFTSLSWMPFLQNLGDALMTKTWM